MKTPQAYGLVPSIRKRDQVIWRYMKLTTFLAMVLSDRREVFFPSLAKLGRFDPNEGRLPLRKGCFKEQNWALLSRAELKEWLRSRSSPEDEAWRSAEMVPTPYPASDRTGYRVLSSQYDNRSDLEAIYRRARVLIRELSVQRFVWCWYGANTESMSQWKIFAETGVAVRSTVGAVLDALSSTKNEVCAYKVRYIDRMKDTPSKLSLTQPFLYKQNCFKQEAEVRFVYANGLTNHVGMILPLKSLNFIDEVVFSPFIEPSEAAALEKWIQRVGRRCDTTTPVRAYESVPGISARQSSEMLEDEQWIVRGRVSAAQDTQFIEDVPGLPDLLKVEFAKKRSGPGFRAGRRQ